MKRYDFIEETIYLIRKLLEKNISKKLTIDEMITKRNKLLQKFIRGGKI